MQGATKLKSDLLSVTGTSQVIRMTSVGGLAPTAGWALSEGALTMTFQNDSATQTVYVNLNGATATVSPVNQLRLMPTQRIEYNVGMNVSQFSAIGTGAASLYVTATGN
jgi:hypothetical protein